jgi:2'-5' RNA ligase
MPYAVCLFFDIPSFEIIAGYWRRIDSLYLRLGAKPHLSLAVFDAVDIPAMEELLGEFASSREKITISLPSIGSFLTDERVIFLAPVVSRALMELHSAFYDRLIERGIAFHPLYAPGNWVPHCTLDMEISDGEYERKIVQCALLDPIRSAGLESIGLIEFRPVRELLRFPLRP